MTEPGPPLAISVFVAAAPVDRFLPTLRSLRRCAPDIAMVVGAPDALHAELASVVEPFAGVEVMSASSSADIVNRIATFERTNVLAVDDAVIVPSSLLERAAMLIGDLRVVAVTFLSNDAGHLSFPHLNTPSGHQVGGLDEELLTRRLRELSPPPEPAPVGFAAGSVVLFTESGLTALGPLAGEFGFRLAAVAAEFSIRGLARGFQTLLDAGTYYSVPTDLATTPRSSFLDGSEIDWIVSQHPFARGVLDYRTEEATSPRSAVMTAARVKALGLRVLIDASAVGPTEMGTQVQTLSLIRELADHPEVVSVAVGLAGPVPRYAEPFLANPKIDARTCPPNDYTAFGHVDIAHRPYQPDLGFDPVAWRAGAARAMVTMQDLIAYQVAPYHRSDEHWHRVRALVRRVISESDGVVAISNDTAGQIRLEQLPVDEQRVHVVENGTDHLSGNEAESVPREVVRRGRVADDFLLVLGASYAHKNRQLAIDTMLELRRRGRPQSLICVGAQVPHGSLRHLETRSLLAADREFGSSEWISILPDVSSEERNWLLRHASLVLYPTSAEGFGLVPFEAAMFGTPTVSVQFGPLAEVSDGPLVGAAHWDATEFADACERLLDDRDAYHRQVTSVRAAGQAYTWKRTADLLVTAYRTVISRPPRKLPG